MSKNTPNKRDSIKALYEGTLDELRAAQEENALKTMHLQSAQFENQMRSSEFDAQLDKLKSSKQELADMLESDLLSADEEAEMEAELSKEEEDLKEQRKKSQEEFEAESKKRVEEVNRLREKIRSLEGKADVHRRILKRIDPDFVKENPVPKVEVPQ